MLVINILYIIMNMKNLLLVVGGPGSSGASTIAKMLAEYFNLERVYSGGVFREIVASQGYKTLDDFYIANRNNKEKEDIEEGIKLPRKTIERSRNYVVAAMIILTGDYYCIREFIDWGWKK